MTLTILLAALCFGLLVYTVSLLDQLQASNNRVAELDRELRAMYRTRHYGGRR